MNTAVVRNVISIVSEGRRVHRQQPQAINPEVPEVAELAGEALEIADTIPVAIGKRLHVQLVDDRILVPKRLRGFRHCSNRAAHQVKFTESAPLLSGALCVLVISLGVAY